MLKLAAIFAAVSVAELGDKTQLAVLLFAGDRAQNPVLVFLAASTVPYPSARRRPSSKRRT